jgi:integrase
MSDEIKRIPKVRMAKPTGRPIQLRYTDPETKREIRITTETYDPIVALEEKAKLEAKLLLGIDAKPKRRVAAGPGMSWELFRERYRDLQLNSLRDRSAECAEIRLDVAERIVKPKTLADMASGETIHELQAKLLDGAESRTGKRSPITARNYIVAVMAALNWAACMGWLPAVPKVRKVKVSKLRQMRGRAITEREFRKLLAKVAGEVGAEAAPSWKYLLRGLWESGLRLGELMNLHWSDESYIVPMWGRRSLPVLAIPAAMQKNNTEESIPLLPGFEALLLETPEPQRFGWVFNPMSLQTMLGRGVRQQRPNAEWVSKVISRVGKASGVVVRPAVGFGVAKYASAHDLRRSCAERLVAAGVPEREVARVLRHADVSTTRKHYAPGTVQDSAAILRKRLGVPGYKHAMQST